MMLELTGLTAAYGTSQVLFGIDMVAPANQVTALLGRNGMGKTTTIKTIMGIVRSNGGQVRFAGRALERCRPDEVARIGIGLVPEGRQVFPNLTVVENLVVTAANRMGEADPWTLDRVLALFPSLAQRRSNLGSQLSGGEQQMLAIGRALMTNPRLLILDEATEGLAPIVRREIWHTLELLKQKGQTILVIDKNVAALARIADHFYILEKGRVAWKGDAQALMGDDDMRHRLLGV